MKDKQVRGCNKCQSHRPSRIIWRTFVGDENSTVSSVSCVKHPEKMEEHQLCEKSANAPIVWERHPFLKRLTSSRHCRTD